MALAATAGRMNIDTRTTSARASATEEIPPPATTINAVVSALATPARGSTTLRISSSVKTSVVPGTGSAPTSRLEATESTTASARMALRHTPTEVSDGASSSTPLKTSGIRRRRMSGVPPKNTTMHKNRRASAIIVEARPSPTTEIASKPRTKTRFATSLEIFPASFIVTTSSFTASSPNATS